MPAVVLGGGGGPWLRPAPTRPQAPPQQVRMPLPRCGDCSLSSAPAAGAEGAGGPPFQSCQFWSAVARPSERVAMHATRVGVARANAHSARSFAHQLSAAPHFAACEYASGHGSLAGPLSTAALARVAGTPRTTPGANYLRGRVDGWVRHRHRVGQRQLFSDSSLATALWRRLFGDSSLATALWRQLFSDSSSATALWRQLFSDSPLATALQRRLFGDSSSATAL